MNHIEGVNRNQIMMTSLDQLVHPKAFVRIIDAFVDAIDLFSFGLDNYMLNEQSRPPYNPVDLLKLYLYGYQHGIRSCRKLEHATKVNVEVMWLIKGCQPHYKTIANFRKNNTKSFRLVFRHFISILKEWKLADGKHIAVDSFKIRAQNSLKNNYNQHKLDRQFKYIDDKINNYLEQLDQRDRQEDKDIIQNKIDHQINKWNGYCKLEQHLIENEQDQISTTDPDAKAVVLHRNIVNVGYNVQAVSDSKNKMIVALDTGSVNDTHALSTMVALTQRNLALKQKTNVLADKGYHTASQLAACELLAVKCFVSPKANAAQKIQCFPYGGF